MVPACGGGEVQDLVQRGRFARTRLTDDAEGAALRKLEADTVDGPHLPPDPAAEHHSFGQRECLDQVADPQHHGFPGGHVGPPQWCRGNAVDLGRGAIPDVFMPDARNLVAGRD